jgi:hypothetical protein
VECWNSEPVQTPQSLISLWDLYNIKQNLICTYTTALLISNENQPVHYYCLFFSRWSSVYRSHVRFKFKASSALIYPSKGVSKGASAWGVRRARCRRWPSSQSKTAEWQATRFCEGQFPLLIADKPRYRVQLTSQTTTVPALQRTRTCVSCDRAMWLYRNLRRWSDSSFLYPTM